MRVPCLSYQNPGLMQRKYTDGLFLKACGEFSALVLERLEAEQHAGFLGLLRQLPASLACSKNGIY